MIDRSNYSENECYVQSFYRRVPTWAGDFGVPVLTTGHLFKSASNKNTDILIRSVLRCTLDLLNLLKGFNNIAVHGGEIITIYWLC